MMTLRSRCRSLLPLLVGLTLACSADGLVGEGELPPDIPDPSTVQTPDGAVAAHRAAVSALRDAFGAKRESFVPVSGMLADELTTQGNVPGIYQTLTWIDVRQPPERLVQVSEGGVGQGAYGTLRTTYVKLQKARGQSQQARGLLRAYAPDRATLVGQLHAIEAYAEVYLADLYCSGIPLSTVDFDGDYTVKPGSTTEEVYAHAVTLFDSALAVVTDSSRWLHLAQVGKARAMLALGRAGEAAAAVAGVPDEFQYEMQYLDSIANVRFFIDPLEILVSKATMGDGEGGNGLDFISSGDPRTAAVLMNTNQYGYRQYRPAKYPANGDGTIPIASGIEARLIEAEALLQAGDVPTWLEKLNHLRRTAWTTIEPAVAGPLPDLSDPGSPDGRIDLLFRERAFWLYLTGHRQGDLRRLIRQYERDPESVYPTGSYPGGPGVYGSDVTLPVPADERAYNPRYTGCVHRDA